LSLGRKLENKSRIRNEADPKKQAGYTCCATDTHARTDTHAHKRTDTGEFLRCSCVSGFRTWMGLKTRKLEPANQCSFDCVAVWTLFGALVVAECKLGSEKARKA